MSYLFEIGKTYTFNTVAPGILPSQVKNAVLEAVLNYGTAIKYENIDLMYRQIYPVLPAGTPDSPKTCAYYLFKTESGEDVVLADQWIDAGTIDDIEGIAFEVTVFNASLNDMNRVRDAMNAMGFRNYEIKQLQV